MAKIFPVTMRGAFIPAPGPPNRAGPGQERGTAVVGAGGALEKHCGHVSKVLRMWKIITAVAGISGWGSVDSRKIPNMEQRSFSNGGESN